MTCKLRSRAQEASFLIVLALRSFQSIQQVGRRHDEGVEALTTIARYPASSPAPPEEEVDVSVRTRSIRHSVMYSNSFPPLVRPCITISCKHACLLPTRNWLVMDSYSDRCVLVRNLFEPPMNLHPTSFLNFHRTCRLA
jgi:hypothetical protein